MALPATDTFTDSNGTLITAHSDWTTTIGTSPDIFSNAACPNSTSDSFSYWDADAFNDNQYSEIEIVAKAETVESIGPMVRVHSSAETGYLFYHSIVRWEVWKAVGGSYSKLDESLRTLNLNDVLYLEADGTDIDYAINESFLGPTSDSSISSGSAGIHTNLNVTTHRGDNWEGGNLGAAGISIPVVYHHLQQQGIA